MAEIFVDGRRDEISACANGAMLAADGGKMLVGLMLATGNCSDVLGHCIEKAPGGGAGGADQKHRHGGQDRTRFPHEQTHR